MLPKKGAGMSQLDEKYLARLRERYRKASKKERSAILDEYVKTTQCHRKHAIAVLRGKRKRVKGPIRRPRSTVYRDQEARALLQLWDLFDGICSKRLRSALDVELPRLYERDFLQVSAECYQKLMQISPATMDRLLKGRRLKVSKSRGFTKPGSLLKDRIPIRTWADWNEDQPGFCEMDLVDHSGGVTIRGTDHAWTLCFTDIKTAWTECVAVRNKAQVHVFAAIQDARRRLPFPLLGIDSDNGSEFINDQLYRYCRDEGITFTRGRAGKKNDNAYVEQKNWSVVRRAVGYYRYDTPQQLELLNRLYAVMHFYTNFFLPVAKLKDKTRIGSKVKKRYDDPQTPYARVLDSSHVSEEPKALLRETYSVLDLVYLRQQIDGLQDKLLNSVSMP
jgi:transposase InsO family protein